MKYRIILKHNIRDSADISAAVFYCSKKKYECEERTGDKKIG